MILTWWEVLILMISNSLVILGAVFLGAWVVFRTKHAQFHVPMFASKPADQNDSAGTYMDGLFEDGMEEGKEDLSEAARRIYDQANRFEGGRKDFLKRVVGIDADSKVLKGEK